jgi:HSP20 family protein
LLFTREGLMKITKWDPFGGMMSDEFFSRNGKEGMSCTWMPVVDVYETESRIVLTAELPGVHLDDIELSIDDGVLMLKGDRRPEKDLHQENYHVLERNYGAFCRRFTMPCEVDAKNISANFKDGVLTVVIPKLNTTKKISVELTG